MLTKAQLRIVQGEQAAAPGLSPDKEHNVTSRQFIEVRGARENNLREISLDIPKQKITVFTGVSGSGKSSLVFDTIAAEAQRQLNETFTAFVQGFCPTTASPMSTTSPT